MNRFEASHFTQMAPFEAVIFNKERPPDRKSAKANLRETACFWDTKELSRAANSYYQAYIENRANQLGISHLFDPEDNVKLEASQSETEQRKQGILRLWRNGTPLGSPSSQIRRTIRQPRRGRAGKRGGRGGSAGRRANHRHRKGSDAPRAWLLAALRSPEGLQQQAAPVPL